jgi:Tfp pilus assembly protein FimV
MFFLALIAVLIGVAAGWRFGSRHSTSRALTQAQQQMRQEVRYWQELAERTKVRADQLAQENEAWAAGYRQGREDVITIVPHIAAQQRLVAQDRMTGTAEMNDCA